MYKLIMDFNEIALKSWERNDKYMQNIVQSEPDNFSVIIKSLKKKGEKTQSQINENKK